MKFLLPSVLILSPFDIPELLTNSFPRAGRRFGFLPMLFYGLLGTPLGPPKPAPITVYVGKPIEVPKVDNPSAEEIENYHFAFIAAVEKIYNDNKSDNGCADIPLRII